MVAYPAHILFFNVSTDTLEYIIDNGVSILGFLPVQFGNIYDVIICNNIGSDYGDDGDISVLGFTHSRSVALHNLVLHMSHRKGHDEEMMDIHNALEAILDPVRMVPLKVFMATTKHRQRWTCFPNTESYCCDLPEGKFMSSILHGTSGRKPCILCIRSAHEFSYQLISFGKSNPDTEKVRAEVDRKVSEEDDLTNCSKGSARKKCFDRGCRSTFRYLYRSLPISHENIDFMLAKYQTA